MAAALPPFGWENVVAATSKAAGKLPATGIESLPMRLLRYFFPLKFSWFLDCEHLGGRAGSCPSLYPQTKLNSNPPSPPPFPGGMVGLHWVADIGLVVTFSFNGECPILAAGCALHSPLPVSNFLSPLDLLRSLCVSCNALRLRNVKSEQLGVSL